MTCTSAEFEQLVGLHKFYFELLVSSATFYLGIVGATIAFVAKAKLAPRQLRLTLLIPLVLSASAFIGYGSGFVKLRQLDSWVQACAASLKYAWAPHSETLPSLSGLFSLIALLIAVGNFAIMVKPQWLEQPQGAALSADA